MDTNQADNETKRISMSSLRVEDVGAEKVRVEHSYIVMPQALAGLSDPELASLGRKATLKLDCFIMPCITIMYILNYLDRQVCQVTLPLACLPLTVFQNIASAKLAGIDDDLNLSAVQYQTTVSILFCESYIHSHDPT